MSFAHRFTCQGRLTCTGVHRNYARLRTRARRPRFDPREVQGRPDVNTPSRPPSVTVVTVTSASAITETARLTKREIDRLGRACREREQQRNQRPGAYCALAVSNCSAISRARCSGATTRANGPKLRIQLRSARSRQTSSVTARPPAAVSSICCDACHSRART